MKFKENVQRDFDINNDFAKIVVLDLDPKVAIARREKVGESNPWPWIKRSPWPWDQLDFLKFFREFYIKELPKLTKSEIIYIDTNKMSKKELSYKLDGLLCSFAPRSLQKVAKDATTADQKKILVKYFEDNKIGYYHSEPILIQGYPSIVSERHVLQLDENGIIVFLNNERLIELAKKLHLTKLT